MPPSTQIDEAIEAARDLRRNWRSYAGLVPTKHVVRADTRVGPDRPRAVSPEAQPGVTLLTGLFDNEVSAILVGLDGTELHRWPIRFHEVWGEAAHLGPAEVPFNDWDTMIHGIVLFPNGDIVFNLEDRGLARMDRCGEVLWRLPYRTHHAVTMDEAGKLWVMGLKEPSTERDPRFPGLFPPYRHETILQVDPDSGRILQEISLLEVIYRSRYEGVLFADGSEWPGDRTRGVTDPLHANHVEVLDSRLAPAFPQFAA
ncbi:MAG: arylsulfotransferase family protein, partial [Geminicoccaceae bacterium]